MRVMIAEDEPAARRKLARLLAAEPDIAVVAEAENGTHAAALAESLRPEVSFEIIRRISWLRPAFGLNLKSNTSIGGSLQIQMP